MIDDGSLIDDGLLHVGGLLHGDEALLMCRHFKKEVDSTAGRMMYQHLLYPIVQLRYMRCDALSAVASVGRKGSRRGVVW